jgi:hypothetical protein
MNWTTFVDQIKKNSNIRINNEITLRGNRRISAGRAIIVAMVRLSRSLNIKETPRATNTTSKNILSTVGEIQVTTNSMRNPYKIILGTNVNQNARADKPSSKALMVLSLRSGLDSWDTHKPIGSAGR